MTQSRLRRILQARLPPLRRWSAHLLFAAVVWPGLTILGTAWALMTIPYYAVPYRDALLAGAAGALLRMPDMLLAGAIVFGFSGFIFRRFGAEPQLGRVAGLRLMLEPLVTFVIIAIGIALWYPAVLSRPLFQLLGFLPVAALLTLLAVLGVAGVLATGRRGMRLRLASVLFVVGLLSPGPLWFRARVETAFGAPPAAILLGVDSISHADDVRPLAEWVKAAGGTWYERAVTPGLFTNAVWTSILTMQPVREHRVFHTFKRLNGESALLRAATSKGYRTVASFSDQLTAAPGSTAGFDENQSGPVGWRQLLLPIVADNSILVPVIGAALPRPWPGAAPSNEAGTFTYDLGREVRQLLRAGRAGQPTLVASHLTYVHLPAYPSSLELSPAEFRSVLKAPAAMIHDRTFDWQDLDRPGDPVPLNAWKIRRVQLVIQREVADARYLEQGGQLILFSDHGSRNSLNTETFHDVRYHHVVLATFGVQPRCPKEPISLIDVARLLGLSDVMAEPSVEFVLTPPGLWPALVQTARLRWSGEVDLDEALLAQVFADMRRYEPWPKSAVPCSQK